MKVKRLCAAKAARKARKSPSYHHLRGDALQYHPMLELRCELKLFGGLQIPFNPGWSQLFASVGSSCGHWLTTKVIRKATK